MPQFLHIPVHQAHAVAAVMACVGGKSMAVAELPLEDEEEKLHLAMALHSWGAPPHAWHHMHAVTPHQPAVPPPSVFWCSRWSCAALMEVVHAKSA